MRVAVVGGTGMIGSWLVDTLRGRGDEALVLTRGKPRDEHQIQWDPSRGPTELGRLEGLDAVVNLAGAPLATRPWTPQRRKLLLESRLEATTTLIEALGRLSRPPPVFLGAGLVARFGDRGRERIDDDDPPGRGFLADLAVAWETEQLRAARLGARAVVLRMGIVLSPTGGAFPLLVQPFRIGFGGWLGPGQQYMPWISIRDVVSSFLHALSTPALTGGVNATVPEPGRNKELFKALGRVLHRPVMVQAPSWALRGAFGDMADDLLLNSLRAVPRKLLGTGFAFRDDDAEATFAWLVEAMRAGRAQAAEAR